MNKENILAIGSLFVVSLLGNSNSADCRENVLSGSLSVQQEYDSNIFQLEDDEEDRWTTTLLPTLALVSTGEKDEVSLTASSDLGWDHRLDERNFTHDLAFSGSRQVSQHWRVTMSDNYSYNDESPERDMDPGLSVTARFQRAGRYEQAEVARLLFPELSYTPDDYLYVLTELDRRFSRASAITQQEVERYLSNTEGRRRYSDNEFSIGAEYEFARDSLLTLGYRYFANDDRSANISEYYEHSPSVGLSYRFNQQWLASVTHEFTKGQYDTANDINENDTLFAVDYTLSPTDQLTASYEYDTTNFQGTSEDILDQTGELGWNHDLTATTRLTTTLSENYLAREYNGDETEAGLDLGISRSLQKGSISLGAGYLYAQQKSDGSWDDLRENWTLDGGITYNLREDLTGTFNLAYEKRYLWPEIGGKEDFDDYEAGAALTYSFSRWFALTCRYTYNKLESNNSIVSGYDEHLIVVGLSAAKELLRW
ncbi:MAG: outer membrane beta-barrel protein [Desulfobulbaceae bacterium]|nr:outer membrane beta-barrel protein [Desulfobulbaceae bacterium]